MREVRCDQILNYAKKLALLESKLKSQACIFEKIQIFY